MRLGLLDIGPCSETQLSEHRRGWHAYHDFNELCDEHQVLPIHDTISVNITAREFAGRVTFLSVVVRNGD